MVDALASFQKTSLRLGRYTTGEQHTVFILATSTFASWLEASSEFIPQALQCVFGSFSSVGVDVVCGVVDGLAPRPVSMEQPCEEEGFSILHKAGKQENVWDNNDTVPNPNLQSTLTFRANKGGKVALTLPLANTLFHNGRHSTLLLSRWRSSGGSFEITRGQTEKQNITLNVLGKERYPHIRTRIPCIPLTPMRRIQSGLGNIVRTIDFGEGGVKDVGSASRELEISVPEYLTKHGHGHSIIDVWALIVPQNAFSDFWMESEEILTTDVDALRAKRSSSTAKGRRYVGDCMDRGAILCKVLSGGGGWGVKQGLLSLDPQTTYSMNNESRYDYSEGSLDEQQVSALGSMAQEGAFIQFLVAVKSRDPVESLEETEPEYVESTRRSTVVGVVPSTVDDIHDEQQEKPAFDLQVYLGHFGCVSESGMFLRVAREKVSAKKAGVETKIDLPYSYIYREYPKRESRLPRVYQKPES